MEGIAHLGGALEVHAATGFAPRAGDHRTILTAGRAISGSFTSVTPGYAVSVVGNSVVLTATAPSEPSATLASLSDPLPPSAGGGLGRGVRGPRGSQVLPQAP